MISFRAASPVSPGTPVAAVGLQVLTGGQPAADPGIAFGITPQPGGLPSNAGYY